MAADPDQLVGAENASLNVTLEGGQAATLAFDNHLLWLTKHKSVSAKTKEAQDPATSFLCIPLDLVLDTSFVPDSDGGSLYVRVLAPPPQQSSPLLPFTKVKSRSSLVIEANQKFLKSSQADSASTSATPTTPERLQAERLRNQLEGPCKRLRLIKIEARIQTDGAAATKWTESLLQKAYHGITPYRRFKVLINPVGGPGKARQLFQSKVRPILEAAGCKLDIQVTTHINHGLQIAKELPLDDYDALLFVSGDGMAHEVLNGFAQRPDAAKALKMPICPIPAGSGNGLCVNLLGPEQGFNLALASLNAIKGRPLSLDVCVVTQPRASGRGKDAARPTRQGKRSDTTSTSANGVAPPADLAVGADADPTPLTSAPELPYEQYYSFLSQAIGLMADIDLGTEHLRALGDTRFVLGFIQGVISNTMCSVDIDVKLGVKGSKNKEEMRSKVIDFNKKGQWDTSLRTQDQKLGSEDQDTSSSGMPPLRHGPVTDPLQSSDGNGSESDPKLSLHDPSWPYSVVANATDPDTDSSVWARIDAPISALYAGKIPFVGRDLMQFPFALPGDGTIDIALLLHGGGRAGKLRAINDAETGSVVYDKSMAYLKVEAYRVTPKLAAGDARLKKGGLVSIDGEHRPYAPFQAEVSPQQATTLSLFGRFNVNEVTPPTPPTE
ncbi:unnamed protein product [Sympodiomycopsis kandeliae]